VKGRGREDMGAWGEPPRQIPSCTCAQPTTPKYWRSKCWVDFS